MDGAVKVEPASLVWKCACKNLGVATNLNHRPLQNIDARMSVSPWGFTQQRWIRGWTPASEIYFVYMMTRSTPQWTGKLSFSQCALFWRPPLLMCVRLKLVPTLKSSTLCDVCSQFQFTPAQYENQLSDTLTLLPSQRLFRCFCQNYITACSCQHGRVLKTLLCWCIVGNWTGVSSEISVPAAFLNDCCMANDSFNFKKIRLSWIRRSFGNLFSTWQLLFINIKSFIKATLMEHLLQFSSSHFKVGLRDVGLN